MNDTTRLITSSLCLLILFCLGWLTACTPRPSAVVLEPVQKAMISYPERGARVAIVVRDGRSALHAHLQFCGSADDKTVENKGYPYLANKHGPDEILAVHLGRIFTEAGYKVVAAWPEVDADLDQLDEKGPGPPAGGAGRYSATEPARFDDPRIPREEEKAAEKADAELDEAAADTGEEAAEDKAEEAKVEAKPEKEAPPPEPWYKDAHAVVFATLSGCSTDPNPKEYASTLTLDLAIQAPDEKMEQSGAWKFQGFGPHVKTPLGLGSGAGKSLNTAYRMLMSQVTNFARTPILHSAIAQAAAIARRAVPRLPSSYAHKIPSTYEVDIDASPEKAEVRVDGQYAGKTPVKGFKIGRGKHHVLVQKKGCDDYNDYVFIMSCAPLEFVLLPVSKDRQKTIYNPF